MAQLSSRLFPLQLLIKQSAHWLVELIFPISCFRCNSQGHYLCFVGQQNGPTFEYFPRKLRGWYLDGLIGATSYNDQPIADAIQALKYQRVRGIGDVLGQWLVGQASHLINKDAVIVPVPLHRRRLAQRGFNQSHLLALAFARSGWQVEEVLVRTVNTVAQVELSRAQRRSNLNDVFRLKRGQKSKVKNKTVFIVDDVATTGTTLNMCAKVLKKFGAAHVFGLVAAKD